MHSWNGLSNFKIFNVMYERFKIFTQKKENVSFEIFIQVFYGFVNKTVKNRKTLE